ncbi:MAG: lactate utilization protein C [Myxococcales bacterium]
MGSREEILARLRSASPPARELPDVRRFGERAADLRARFARSLQDAGGVCVPLPSADALPAALEELAPYREGSRIASLVPGIPRANVRVDDVADPHDLRDVDLAIVPGDPGVAENGAVWFTDRGLRHRVLPWIAQHLALVVSGERLVNDMHEAYEQIAVGDGFGCFISGPSKTADIEQALVIGAHGPRSATVFLIG